LAKALSRSSPYVSLTLVLYINNKEKIYNYWKIQSSHEEKQLILTWTTNL
jgi:hypothetical protein